ncbi:MAG: SDR family NAD(P)-dependent oxidoreductase, partial [Deltaproteobacteria bacterium]|nr:SDR family NAD(P)-dependent oxidoreductase [Deltaproteobacteria bacterium]
MSSESKVAIITGAGRGIGKACAERFAKEGYDLVVADWENEAGEASADHLKSLGVNAIFCHADVSVEKDCHNFA